ncbi:hypothetical protein [Pseudomonas asiatica]|uniref:hypothetical protein n=1 Tax=Pseudomonas asiatica TaxID=2219225 RepID=UPI0010BF954C|nr:hypothetical protein [Pseudomonas asiatica]EKT4529591.1 hypothetical protein [Pseudomonas putida]
MASQQYRDTGLSALAAKLDKSTLPVSERACLVTLPDGTSRLGATQVTQSIHHGGEYAGALFCRVAFRFAGEDAEYANTYSSTEDVVWMIVDHKKGLIQFGPDEGVFIRHRGLGIGSYILGQLLRMLHSGSIQGSCRITTSKLPLSGALSWLPPEEAVQNEQRLESVLRSAGFYYSSAAGERVIGARKASDLRSYWNGEKIRFLNPAQLFDTAAAAVAVCAQTKLENSAQAQKNEALGRDLSFARDEVSKVTSAFELALSTHASYEEAWQLREEQLNAEIQCLNDAKAELERELETTRLAFPNDQLSNPTPPPQPARVGSVPKSRVVLELGQSARTAVWAYLASFCVLGICALAVLGTR